MEKRDRSIRVGDVELAYWSVGKGVPLVVLGGPWFGHSYIQPLADQLAGGFQVITYDPRGSGRSSPLTADRITLAGHLADLEGLRDELGIQRLNLIGHSFGAQVAQVYATEHPETASLVLANPGPPFDREMQEMLHGSFVNGRTAEDRKRMEEIESSPGFLSRDAKTHEEFFKILYAPFFEDRRHIKRLQFGFTLATAQYALEAEEQLVEQLLERDPAASLGKISCPTLVIHAERDLIPEASSRSLAEGIRGAEYVNLRGVGHFAYLEDPALFTSTVVAFLKKDAR